jgi:ferritin
MHAAVLAATNEQIKHELFSAYLYLSMAVHFDHENLPGFAHWMKLQAQEEVAHAMRLADYANRRGGKVELQAIDQPTTRWGAPLEIFQAALDHERKVTALIHSLYAVAGEHSDVATQQELLWFIEEQVEEEDSAGAAVDSLRMAGEDSAALLMLDREFSQRVADAPASDG